MAGNVVVGGSGGGLNVAAGSVTLMSTIVAENTNGTGAGAIADDIAGKVSNKSTWNLIGTGGSGGLTNGAGHNQVGVASPGLGTLGGNGGPTETIALLAGSPAIGKGSNPEGLLTDQRGFVIPAGTTLDVGAYQTSAVSDTAPAATLQAANVSSSSPLDSYSFSITVTDNGAIAATSLAGVVVTVIPPGGGPAIPATIVSATPVGPTDALGDAGQFVLDLEITPPGGFWSGAANGVYTVDLGGTPITNLQGLSAPTGALGTFTVDLGTLAFKSSGLTYNRAAHTDTGTITLTNTGTNYVSGPFFVVFLNLTSGVTLSSPTPGVTVGTYGGSPDLEISFGKLLPGQSITITVVFGDVSLGEKVTYTPEVFIGVLPSLTESSRPAVLGTTPDNPS